MRRCPVLRDGGHVRAAERVRDRLLRRGAEREGHHDHERDHEHGREPLLPGRDAERLPCEAPDPVERHHDQAAEQDRADVREEQQQGAARLAVGARLEREPDDGERRHERDRDRDTRERVRDVVPREREGADGAGRERRDEIDDPRVDACRDLEVRRRHDGKRREVADEPGDRHDRGRARHDQQERAAEVRAVAGHHGEDGPEDRRHQRRDDHRPDHRRRRVREHPGGRDQRGQDQERPEAAQLAAALGAVEQEVVPHAPEVGVGDREHLRTLPSTADG